MAYPCGLVMVMHQVLCGLRAAAAARSRARAGSSGPRPWPWPGRPARPSRVASGIVKLVLAASTGPASPAAGTAPVAVAVTGAGAARCVPAGLAVIVAAVSTRISVRRFVVWLPASHGLVVTRVVARQIAARRAAAAGCVVRGP